MPYLEHFLFTKKPFLNESDAVDNYFLKDEDYNLPQMAAFSLVRQKSLIKITASAGMGKTFIAHKIYNEVLKNTKFTQKNTFLIKNSNCDENEFIKQIKAIFDVKGTTKFEILQNIEKEVKRAIIIIDDAHLLGKTNLLNIIELSNIKGLSIALLGENFLNKILSYPELKVLKNRFSFNIKIPLLTNQESLKYIDYKLNNSTKVKNIIFENCAKKLIAGFSKGCITKINNICDKSLLNAYGEGDKIVRKKHVYEAVNLHKNYLFILNLLKIFLILLILFGLFTTIDLFKNGTENLLKIGKETFLIEKTETLLKADNNEYKEEENTPLIEKKEEVKIEAPIVSKTKPVPAPISIPAQVVAPVPSPAPTAAVKPKTKPKAIKPKSVTVTPQKTITNKTNVPSVESTENIDPNLIIRPAVRQRENK